MGGYGSGSYYRFSSGNTVEDCRSLDIRDWKRRGLIREARHFKWHWFSGEEETGCIDVRVENLGAVILSFRTRSHPEGDWESVEQRLPLSWTACNYGAERPWFRCSAYRDGVYCGRRVAKLYADGKLFACRHCYQLSYQSQREPSYGRALLKSQKIRMKLGGSPASTEPFPDKPKGMHWRTYRKLEEEAENALLASWAGVAERLGVEY